MPSSGGDAAGMRCRENGNGCPDYPLGAQCLAWIRPRRAPPCVPLPLKWREITGFGCFDPASAEAGRFRRNRLCCDQALCGKGLSGTPVAKPETPESGGAGASGASGIISK